MNVTFMCRSAQIHALKNAWYKILYHAQKRGLDFNVTTHLTITNETHN